MNRRHLKKRILVQDQGGTEFQPDGVAVTAIAGILKYVEDLKRGLNPAKRREANPPQADLR